MNADQKTYFMNWAKRKRVKSNVTKGNLSLSTVVQDLFVQYGFSKEESLTQYKNRVHPILFLRYLGDWSKCRHISLPEWKELNREWVEICWKQRWALSGELNIYRNIDELRGTINSHFGEFQIMESTYDEAIKSLHDLQELKLQKEERENAKRKESSFDILQAALNSSPEVKRPPIKEEPAKKPEPVKQATLGDVFEEQSVDTRRFFDESIDDSLFKSQIPSICKNQILFYKGVARAHFNIRIQVKQPYIKVKTIRSTGKRYIYTYDQPGVGYSVDNGELVIKNSDFCVAFLELYGFNKWMILTLSDNISENDDVQAFEILNVQGK